MAKDRVFALCDGVRQTAYDLHHYIGHGHLEKVYEKGMVHRLRKAGVQVEAQVPLQVRDEDGTLLGDYFADLFVEDVLVVELKACRNLTTTTPPSCWATCAALNKNTAC